MYLHNDVITEEKLEFLRKNREEKTNNISNADFEKIKDKSSSAQIKPVNRKITVTLVNKSVNAIAILGCEYHNEFIEFLIFDFISPVSLKIINRIDFLPHKSFCKRFG